MRRLHTRHLYDALDARRRERGLTWEQVAREIGVSAPILRRTSMCGRLEADGIILMVEWVGRTVEIFVHEAEK